MPCTANFHQHISRSILLKTTSKRARGTLAIKPQTASGDMPWSLMRHHAKELRGLSNIICSDFSFAEQMGHEFPSLAIQGMINMILSMLTVCTT